MWQFTHTSQSQNFVEEYSVHWRCEYYRSRFVAAQSSNTGVCHLFRMGIGYEGAPTG